MEIWLCVIDGDWLFAIKGEEKDTARAIASRIEGNFFIAFILIFPPLYNKLVSFVLVHTVETTESPTCPIRRTSGF